MKAFNHRSKRRKNLTLLTLLSISSKVIILICELHEKCKQENFMFNPKSNNEAELIAQDSCNKQHVDGPIAMLSQMCVIAVD